MVVVVGFVTKILKNPLFPILSTLLYVTVSKMCVKKKKKDHCGGDSFIMNKDLEIAPGFER